MLQLFYYFTFGRSFLFTFKDEGGDERENHGGGDSCGSGGDTAC